MTKKDKKIPELIILVGPPGAGKSTWANATVAQHNDYVRVNRDDLRKQFKGSYTVADDIEKLVSKAQDELIQTLLENKYTVIVDNTHCKLKYIKELITKFHSISSVSVKFVDSQADLKELKRRNSIREKPVPETVLEKMYKNFNNVVKNRAEITAHLNACYMSPLVTFKQNDKLPKCILVDIDGTVAHMGDARGPFEWNKVDRDAPDEQVLNLIRVLALKYKIVFMSGRDESCRRLTQDWLDVFYKYNDDEGTPHELYMRPANNFEKDNIVKKNLFFQHIAPKYYVEAVLDDRDQVVKMWRQELGLKCLQVEYGNF